MNFFSEEENYSVSKFESMLQKNHIFFFDVDEFKEIIEYYLELGKMSKAKHALQIGLNQHPSAISLKLLQVEVMIFEDELQQALEILNHLEVIEPSNSEVYVQKANLYSKLNEHDKAIELLTYALSLTDDLVDIYSLIAMEYLFIENYAEAKKYFKKCLSEDIEDYMSLQQLLFCYDILEENDEAIAFLDAYLNKNPYCEVAWHYLGKQYLVLSPRHEIHHRQQCQPKTGYVLPHREKSSPAAGPPRGGFRCPATLPVKMHFMFRSLFQRRASRHVQHRTNQTHCQRQGFHCSAGPEWRQHAQGPEAVWCRRKRIQQ